VVSTWKSKFITRDGEGECFGCTVWRRQQNLMRFGFNAVAAGRGRHRKTEQQVPVPCVALKGNAARIMTIPPDPDELRRTLLGFAEALRFGGRTVGSLPSQRRSVDMEPNSCFGGRLAVGTLAHRELVTGNRVAQVDGNRRRLNERAVV